MKNIIFIFLFFTIYSNSQTRFDEIQNGDETGIDCGGSTGVVCTNGAALKAFPGAVGFGKYTVGGRGGTVYTVTNLNASGSGSFREAYEASGARIVVTNLGGTIDLGGNDIIITNPYLTILGHSSPLDGGGITFTNGNVQIRTDEVIVRYTRFRGNAGGSNDAFAISSYGSGFSNIILDHCSFSYGTDENLGIFSNCSGNITDVTISNGLFSFPFDYKNILQEACTQNITYFNNLLTHGAERNIRLKGGSSYEMVNNLIYNYGYACDMGTDTDFSIINNHFKEGSNGTSGTTLINNIPEGGFDINDSQMYISGNTWNSGISLEYDTDYNGLLLGAPFMDSGLPIVSVAKMTPYVIANAGANYPFQDAVDVQAISDYINDTGVWVTSLTGTPGIPTLAAGTAWTDSDGDGMRDDFEGNDYGDISQSSSGDFYSTGWSNIEELYNSLVDNISQFDGAYGWGKKATGGKGGVVYLITTDADSGAGSLREALLATGPRYIIFANGFRIHLDTTLFVTDGDFTVLGNSAPADSDGVTISGGSVIIATDNFIFRYVKFRMGDNGYKNAAGTVVCPSCAGGDDDTVRIGGSDTWMFDHCEVLWGVDETFSINGTGTPVINGTIQNSIIAEGLSDSYHSEGPHGFGPLLMLETDRVSFIRNYMGRHTDRHIRVREDNTFEMINNVVNGFSWASIYTRGSQFLTVNNHFQRAYGLAIAASGLTLIKPTGSGTQTEMAYIEGNTKDTPSQTTVITSGFSTVGTPPPSANSGYYYRYLLTAPQAIDTVLANAGAIYPIRDFHTLRIIADYQATSGGLIDSQEEVGGYLTPAAGTPMVDEDNDGIDDVAEQAFITLHDLGVSLAAFLPLDDALNNGRDNIMDVYNSLVDGEVVVVPPSESNGVIIDNRNIWVNGGKAVIINEE